MRTETRVNGRCTFHSLKKPGKVGEIPQWTEAYRIFEPRGYPDGYREKLVVFE